MSKAFKINSFQLGEILRPYIIAEIGVNHEGSIETAKELIRQAHAGGANAAKFQSYKADKIAIKDSPAYWDTSQEPTKTQHALFQKHDSFEQQDFECLAEYCGTLGIDFMSTPFDLEAADFLAPLMPAFKIASADITNLPLIRKCASYGKPLILSTGASTLAEVALAAQEASAAGASEIALLHCVLQYPTPAENAQLGFIRELQREFPENAVGYSDHVIPDDDMSCLQVATLMGCSIIEKHFTHDKRLPGNDHYHAMDRENLLKFSARLDIFRTLYGSGRKSLDLERDAILHARRSIVAARKITAGEALSEENLIAKRPGHGISPSDWDTLIGARAMEDIEQDALIQWHQIDIGREI